MQLARLLRLERIPSDHLRHACASIRRDERLGTDRGRSTGEAKTNPVVAGRGLIQMN